MTPEQRKGLGNHFQQDRDVQDQDGPVGGTEAARAGDAKKGPYRGPVVLPASGGISPLDAVGAALKRELAAAGREGQPRSSQDLQSWDWLFCQRWVPAITHSSGYPNSPSPSPKWEWGLPCTDACWCPGLYCSGWRKLGYSTPSIGMGMGIGTTQGCWSSTPTHHLKNGNKGWPGTPTAPWQDTKGEPRG